MAPVFSSPTRFGEYERRQIRAFPVSAAGREPMMGAPTTSNQGPDYTPTCNVMLFIVVNAAVCCVCVLFGAHCCVMQRTPQYWKLISLSIFSFARLNNIAVERDGDMEAAGGSRRGVLERLGLAPSSRNAPRTLWHAEMCHFSV